MAGTRRRLLQSTATVVSGCLAGCLGPESPDGQGGSLTVQVTNRSESVQTVAATVVDADGEVRERYADIEVRNGVSETRKSAGYEPGSYRIRVEGGDWSTADDWNPERCLNYVFITTIGGAAENPSVSTESDCTTES